jgi:hypothetical protein
MRIPMLVGLAGLLMATSAAAQDEQVKAVEKMFRHCPGVEEDS